MDREDWYRCSHGTATSRLERDKESVVGAIAASHQT